MSEQQPARDFYYHDPFHDASSFMSFTECLHGSTNYDTLATAFGLSPSSSQPFSTPKDHEPKPKMDIGETPVTPNSSAFSTSTEAGDDEDGNNISKKDKQQKEGGESSKKEVNMVKKKGEKKEKEPKFAFMTKSEVDHLEDGYRWRKYGQKAVKNSPYPRSYYRCTTQKCTVKKRVERSYQDPSTVITTYEGTHNHHLPATLRGNVAGMFPHSLLNPAQGGGHSFPHQDFLLQMPPAMLNNHHPFNYNHASTSGDGVLATPSIIYHHQQQQQHHQQMNNNLTPFQQLQISEYGLLQDMVPSMGTFKQEP